MIGWNAAIERYLSKAQTNRRTGFGIALQMRESCSGCRLIHTFVTVRLIRITSGIPILMVQFQFHFATYHVLWSCILYTLLQCIAMAHTNPIADGCLRFEQSAGMIHIRLHDPLSPTTSSTIRGVLQAAVGSSAGLLSRWHGQGYSRLQAQPAHDQHTRCWQHICLLHDCRKL